MEGHHGNTRRQTLPLYCAGHERGQVWTEALGLVRQLGEEAPEGGWRAGVRCAHFQLRGAEGRLQGDLEERGVVGKCGKARGGVGTEGRAGQDTGQTG